jgi:hypothetical protein
LRKKCTFAVLILAFMTEHAIAQSPKFSEQSVELGNFGFKKGSCESRQSAHFLDDNRLILSAPLIEICDKSNWSNALRTQLTVIDLHGTVLATKTRQDVYATKAGPIGYAAVCTADSLELVSSDLGTARVISVRPSKWSPCGDIGGLSPSRTSISIRDFGESSKSPARLRLIQAESEQPIMQKQLEKREFLAGITESGYAICSAAEHHDCAQFTVNGAAWTVEASVHPRFRGGLFLSANELLLSPDRGKALISQSPEGTQKQIANLHGFQPPFIDSETVEISATAPRRVLYSATGCYIGDFDDCYGIFYHHFVVFDPQTHESLFQHGASSDSAAPIISPDGHTVAVLDRTKLHLYRIP